MNRRILCLAALAVFYLGSVALAQFEPAPEPSAEETCQPFPACVISPPTPFQPGAPTVGITTMETFDPAKVSPDSIFSPQFDARDLETQNLQQFGPIE